MAKEAKKDPQELTVEQKLKALFQLQTMLSKIDEIKTLRGELPLEVQDLEDEIAGLSTRIERIQSEVADLKSAIATKKVEIETAKASVANALPITLFHYFIFVSIQRTYLSQATR